MFLNRIFRVRSISSRQSKAKVGKALRELHETAHDGNVCVEPGLLHILKTLGWRYHRTEWVSSDVVSGA
ncbi:hypothetical protein OUZ56_007814 [Daphnia magna]|uniref:Uncharacterized protein n=1 Tax=Daphnia magna TaxID=35525 RepID=A0ABR0ABA1_9CRUS|nr:hypothetical protein OUZ56_007814 [Daphnia magna]